jgi:transposase
MTNAIVGIDVSKAKIDVTWLKNPETLKIKTKIFENNYAGFVLLIEWIKTNTDQPATMIHCIMEATGIYHEPLALWLYDQGVKVTVANPAHVKNFAKGLGTIHKTDKKDSFLLARYGNLVKPALWQPEAKNIRELKALLSRLEALEGDLLREKNRLEKVEFSESSPRVTESIKAMIHHLQAERDKLDQEIDDHINRYPDLKKDQTLLQSIPAIGKVTSRLMLTVIRGKQFESAGQCAAFLGLIPKQQESGIFRGRTTLSKKGNPLIRAKLYMAAIVASQHNPCIKAQKERLLKNGKTKMQALGAAMRKLVHICFGVLKNQTEYSRQVAL